MSDPRVVDFRVLVVASDADAAREWIALIEADRAAIDWRFASTASECQAALRESWDVVLLDYGSGIVAPVTIVETVRPGAAATALVVITDPIGEEAAIAAIRQGVDELVLREAVSRRLTGAVGRAVAERRRRAIRQDDYLGLVEAERRLRYAIEAAEVGVWEAELDSGRVYWSPVLERQHGLAPGTFEGTFDAFFERIHPEDRAKTAEAIDRATHERGESSILYRTTWPNGEIRWLRGMGRTFYSPEGHPLRARGIGLDVTSQQALEEQLRQAQKMETVGQLAGGVAHDFNNVLTAVRGYIDLIAEDLGPGHRVQFELEQVKIAAARATALTRQLLAFSRRQVLDPSVLDLREVVTGIEPMLRRLLGEDITIVTRTTAIGHVYVDRGQVEQVILNLAVNARDAMPEAGTLAIELDEVELDESYVRAHRGATTGPHVMLAMSDTGLGMDAATQARIFEPFFTTKERGTGLGLATVFGIVKQSGGNIWVYSEPGKGTTFKVYLPRVDAPVDAGAPAEAPTSASGSETVLLVEDDEAVGALSREVLGRRGYTVHYFQRPLHAIERIKDGLTADLLITDMVMPDMNGKELAELVRGARPAIRVLYMSGYTSTMVTARGGLPPGAVFLQKPFTPEELARKVREVLG